MTPEGYFESLPAVILSRIHGEQKLQLPVAPKVPEVPAGYFEGLADRVMGKIAQDLTTPTLDSIGNKMPQSIPEGYFETLAENLVARQHKPATVISIRSFRWVRYAAAAVLVGLMAGGAWLFIRNEKHHNDQPDITLGADNRNDTLSEAALANFLDQTRALDNIDQSSNDITKPEDMALLNLDDQKVGEILSTITDKEITDYVSSDPNSTPIVMKN
jgi:hypothetical protein